MRKLVLFICIFTVVAGIAKPVASNIGARQISTIEEDALECPYITDGLVAMWDAEWNAGLGKHDPSKGIIEIFSKTPTYVRRGSYTIEDNRLIGSSVVVASPSIPAIVALAGG